MTDAVSPTTNTPGTSGTSRHGPTVTRPARSVLAPSIFTIVDAATPAVHRTVALGDPFTAGDHALLIDLFDLDSRHNLDAELFEPLGYLLGQGFGEARKHAVA